MNCLLYVFPLPPSSLRSLPPSSLRPLRDAAIPSSAASPLQYKNNNKAVKVALLFLSYEQHHTPSTRPHIERRRGAFDIGW